MATQVEIPVLRRLKLKFAERKNELDKFGRWGTFPTFYPADSFGVASDSSKVILVNFLRKLL